MRVQQSESGHHFFPFFPFLGLDFLAAPLVFDGDVLGFFRGDVFFGDDPPPVMPVIPLPPHDVPDEHGHDAIQRRMCFVW